MRYHPSHRNSVWTVLFSIITALSLNGCGDTSKAPAPPPGPAALTVTSGSPLPSGTKDIAYSTTLAADGGNPGYTWSLKTGSGFQSLPPGLQLSTAGVISGTPTAIITTSPTFRVVDKSTPTAQSAEKQLTIAINAVPQPTISAPASLPNGIVSTAYSATLTASAGTPPYTTWSVNPPLPTGLTLTPAGPTATVTGSLAAPYNNSHTFSVTDSFSPTPQTGTRSYTLTFTTAPLTLTITTPSPLLSGIVTQPYSTTLAATGGTPPLTWNLASGSPALPNGLTLNSSTGVLSGTPTTAVAVSPIFRVQDSASSPQQSNQKALSITIILPAAPNITTSSLPNGDFNQSYNQTLSVSGGTAPFVWSFNGQLPPGLSLNPSTGAISGIPTSTGTFNFTPQVIDSTFQTDPTPPALSIRIVAPALSITTTSPLPIGTVNQTYPTTTLQASGGTPPLTWDPVVQPALPNGLSWDAATHTISGIPLNGSQGTADHTFTVRDSTNPVLTATRSLSLTINLPAPPNITTTSASLLPNGTVTQLYSRTLQRTGGTAPFTWSFTGTLPTGLALDTSTGVISGTPTVANTFNFTPQVTDALSQTDTTPPALSITIDAAPTTLTITTTSPLPAGKVNDDYGTVTPAVPVTLTASGGTPPYTWSTTVTPPLPTGLSIDAAGTISGTPTVDETNISHTFTVTDSSSTSVSQALSLTIDP